MREMLVQKPKNPTHDNQSLSVPKPRQNETSKLEDQIAELTKQVEKLAQSQNIPGKSESIRQDCLAMTSNSMRRPFRVPGMPRAWFCFKCGEDKHIAAHCSNEPNPTLVHRKNRELKEKQDKFLSEQAASPFSLNV